MLAIPLHAAADSRSPHRGVEGIADCAAARTAHHSPDSPATCANLRPGDAVAGWHPRKIDYRALSILAVLQPGRLYVVAHSDFDAPVVAKLDDAWSSSPSSSSSSSHSSSPLDCEVAIYQQLHGSGITPEFRGHVTGDSGRSMGFLMEYIAADGPAATPSHQQRRGCLTALRRLHRRGIAHGDAHDGNCLLRPDGSAVLVDFELAEATSAAAEFERDLDVMERCIRAAP